jgi:hypothetical protein
MDNTHTTRRAGLFESAIQKLFTRGAQVLAVDEIGGGFRLLTLGGAALSQLGLRDAQYCARIRRRISC